MKIFGYKVDWRLILWIVIAIMIGHLVKGQMDGFTVTLDDGTKAYTGEHVSKCFTEKNQWPDKYWPPNPGGLKGYNAGDKFTDEQWEKFQKDTENQWTNFQQKSKERALICKNAWKESRYVRGGGGTTGFGTKDDNRFKCVSGCDFTPTCQMLSGANLCENTFNKSGDPQSIYQKYTFMVGHAGGDINADQVKDWCPESCAAKNEAQICKAGGGHWRPTRKHLDTDKKMNSCVCFKGTWDDSTGQCL